MAKKDKREGSLELIPESAKKVFDVACDSAV
jgi:hypothetical protein